jgi:hypothetical protein
MIEVERVRFLKHGCSIHHGGAPGILVVAWGGLFRRGRSSPELGFRQALQRNAERKD